MIDDSIALLNRYASTIPHFEAVSRFLSSNVAALPDGRVEIDGTRVYANIQTYGTRRLEDGVFEAHRRYIDLQAILDGEELCGVVAGADWLRETAPYDDARDVRFFASPQGYATLPLRRGLFALFHPEDAHMPGIAPGALGKVRKCVVKILA